MAFALGLDVSVWQDVNSTPQQIDFAKARAAGATFTFIKASQSTYADQDILYNWKSSKSAGLLRGAYHFLVWEKPIQQAQFFYGLLKDDPGELPPVVDYEWWGTTPSGAIGILWEFIVEIERLMGKKPIIYTAPGFWIPFGQINSTWASYPLWLADYGANNPNFPKAKPDVPKPWKDWLFWQFTSKGDGLKFGAESKSIDMNYFNGTEEDLYAKYGRPNTIPNVPETMPIKQGAKCKVLVSALNVRSGAGVNYPVIGQVNDGDVFEIMDIAGNDAWLQIDNNQYICARQQDYKYVEIIDN